MSFQGAFDKIVDKLKNEIAADLTYHNLEHAQNVVKALDEHLLTLEMDPRKVELVRLAGVGHDLGFVKTYDGHEMQSILLLKPILKKEGYSEEEIHEVSAMIWSTKLENKPRTFMEKMLVDADLEYLGGDDFEGVLKRLFEEWVNYKRIPDDYPLFLENTVIFMNEHHYETDYSKAYSNKVRNLRELTEYLASS